MLEGLSSGEADGLCRLLVYDRWISIFFLSSEILQAVRAGVPGRIQRGEDALRHPPQILSQWTQKGI